MRPRVVMCREAALLVEWSCVAVCILTVDDIRSVSAQMLDEHFREHSDRGLIGRVEYLPVRWHSALHGDATGIDR